jgi:tetratricopeptide (TPR) repeat protein
MRTDSSRGRVIAATLVALPLALGNATAVAAPAGHRSLAVQSDGLSPDALMHLRRGAEYYKRGAYPQAEIEFARVEHFAPDWPAVHYNRAAAAEAQGKLDRAIEGYTTYLPHADESQKRSLELRVDELERRRDDGLKLFRQQRALAWSVFGGGLAVMAGGVGMLAGSYTLEDGQQKSRLQYGGYFLAIGGLTVAGALGLSLVIRANRTKKAIRGLAFAPAGSREGFGGSMSFRF